MFNNRRRFLQTTGLAAGSLVLGGLGSLPLSASHSSETLNTAERHVSSVIAQYGRCVRIKRGAGSVTEFKVKLHSLKHFSEVFDPGHLPFERIQVGRGNILRFKHQGAEFRIRNMV